MQMYRAPFLYLPGAPNSLSPPLGKGGGQGRSGVKLLDSLMDEAVLQSAGPGLETLQSPP